VSDRLRWPTVIAVSAVSLDLLALGNVHGGVRLLVTLWFLLVCTGMSFVPLLTLPSVAIELFVGVVMSLVLDTLAATVLVEAVGSPRRSAWLCSRWSAWPDALCS
jgi:hypothetical protein